MTRVDELQRAVSTLEAAGSPPVGVVATTRPRRGWWRARLHRARGTRRAARATKRSEIPSGAAGTTTEVPVA
jgi:hypothetical protein